jgi:hypothetical protein
VHGSRRSLDSGLKNLREILLNRYQVIFFFGKQQKVSGISDHQVNPG